VPLRGVFQASFPVAASKAAIACVSLPSTWTMSLSRHSTGVLPGPFSWLSRRSRLVHSTRAVRVSRQAVP
jgi:hypothetical protein